MRRVALAFLVFFKVLASAAIAEQVRRVLTGEKLPATGPAAPEPTPLAKPEPPKREPARSDALNLLSALQREARLVDFMKEPIGEYSDAQIGAAVRDVHRDCAALLERVFSLRPLVDGAEGSDVSVPAAPEAARFKLVGNVTGQPPFRGRLCHHGWQATKMELPEWTGAEAAARVVAPAEVELK